MMCTASRAVIGRELVDEIEQYGRQHRHDEPVAEALRSRLARGALVVDQRRATSRGCNQKPLVTSAASSTSDSTTHAADP